MPDKISLDPKAIVNRRGSRRALREFYHGWKERPRNSRWLSLDKRDGVLSCVEDYDDTDPYCPVLGDNYKFAQFVEDVVEALADYIADGSKGDFHLDTEYWCDDD